MDYAILDKGAITATGTARALWPNTSFPPTGPNAAFLAEKGAVLIRSDVAYDSEAEILERTDPYLLNGEVFNTSPAPIPPQPVVPQWVAFGAVVMGTPEIKALLNQAIALGEAPLAMGLAVGLGKAADGDSRVFLGAWTAALAGGLVPAELVAHMQALGATYDLPAEFIAGLAPQDAP